MNEENSKRSVVLKRLSLVLFGLFHLTFATLFIFLKESAELNYVLWAALKWIGAVGPSALGVYFLRHGILGSDQKVREVLQKALKFWF